MTEPLPLSKNDSAVVFDYLTDQAPLYGFPDNGVFLCLVAEMGISLCPNGQMERPPLPRKSASAGRFKPLSWTPRHNLRPLWGKNLARMGACGLAAYGLKHFCPGGGLAVGPCAPAPVPTHAQGCRDLCGNTRQKTTRFSQIRKRLRISFPRRSLTHRRGVCARVTPASCGRVSCCRAQIYPPSQVLAPSEILLPPGPLKAL